MCLPFAAKTSAEDRAVAPHGSDGIETAAPARARGAGDEEKRAAPALPAPSEATFVAIIKRRPFQRATKVRRQLLEGKEKIDTEYNKELSIGI